MHWSVIRLYHAKHACTLSPLGIPALMKQPGLASEVRFLANRSHKRARCIQHALGITPSQADLLTDSNEHFIYGQSGDQAPRAPTCQHLQLHSQQMAAWCPDTSLSPSAMLLSDKRPMLTWAAQQAHHDAQ